MLLLTEHFLSVAQKRNVSSNVIPVEDKALLLRTESIRVFPTINSNNIPRPTLHKALGPM